MAVCSFTLTAKIPKKFQPILKPTTLGEHLRRERLKRKHLQGFVAELLNINQMYLSSWELNQKKPHPKHLENIIEYLGYLPQTISKSELLGTQTKYYRMKYNLTLEELCQMTNMTSNVVTQLETKRFRKTCDSERRAMIQALSSLQKKIKMQSIYLREKSLLLSW